MRADELLISARDLVVTETSYTILDVRYRLLGPDARRGLAGRSG